LNKQKAALPIILEKKDLIALIIDSIQDIKGKNIILLDLRGLDDAPTDYFVICEADSNTQMRAISGNVYKRLKQEAHLLPNHVEGENGSRWVLIDYFDMVVHIFHPEAREFYELEELWSDAKFTEYPNL
jgi:ribosome-associated protein